MNIGRGESLQISYHGPGGSQEKLRLALGRAVAATNALMRGDVRLAGGDASDWYFDARRLLLNNVGIHAVGPIIAKHLLSSEPRVTHIGGPALGALPLISAVIMAASSPIVFHGRDGEISMGGREPMSGFFMRETPKAHGPQASIEGNFPRDKNVPVAIVDDVVTTGASIMRAIEAVEERGNPIVAVMCVLNRSDKGNPHLHTIMSERGYEFTSLMRVVKDEAEAE